MLAQRDGLLGWATGRLIYHDNLAPGAIRRLLANGPARRQAVFALLAVEAANRNEETIGAERADDAAIRRAEIIRDGGARDVLAEALGHQPPRGLRGGLERVGLSLLKEPRLYQRLIEIYTDPNHRIAAEALRYCGPTTANMIRVLEVLPVTLVHPSVLKRVDSVGEARAFIEAVQFAKFVNSRCTDDALRYALSHMREGVGLDDVLSRSVRRADRQLGVPLAADDEVRPVASVKDMIFTGRAFRNCLTTDRRIAGALLGTSAYAVFRELVVMEFIHLSVGMWLLVDTHGPRNATVPPELEEAARTKCFTAGVAFLPRVRGQFGHFGRFARFGDDFDPRLLNMAA
jgi:hypothetical protein